MANESTRYVRVPSLASNGVGVGLSQTLSDMIKWRCVLKVWTTARDSNAHASMRIPESSLPPMRRFREACSVQHSRKLPSVRRYGLCGLHPPPAGIAVKAACLLVLCKLLERNQALTNILYVHSQPVRCQSVGKCI